MKQYAYTFNNIDAIPTFDGSIIIPRNKTGFVGVKIDQPMKLDTNL